MINQQSLIIDNLQYEMQGPKMKKRNPTLVTEVEVRGAANIIGRGNDTSWIRLNN